MLNVLENIIKFYLSINLLIKLLIINSIPSIHSIRRPRGQCTGYSGHERQVVLSASLPLLHTWAAATASPALSARRSSHTGRCLAVLHASVHGWPRAQGLCLPGWCCEMRGCHATLSHVTWHCSLLTFSFPFSFPCKTSRIICIWKQNRMNTLHILCPC